MDPAIVAAFISGIGAVLGGFWTVRATRKRMDAECEKRIELLLRGVELGEHLHETHRSDSE